MLRRRGRPGAPAYARTHARTHSRAVTSAALFPRFRCLTAGFPPCTAPHPRQTPRAQHRKQPRRTNDLHRLGSHSCRLHGVTVAITRMRQCWGVTIGLCTHRDYAFPSYCVVDEASPQYTDQFKTANMHLLIPQPHSLPPTQHDTSPPHTARACPLVSDSPDALSNLILSHPVCSPKAPNPHISSSLARDAPKRTTTIQSSRLCAVLIPFSEWPHAFRGLRNDCQSPRQQSPRSVRVPRERSSRRNHQDRPVGNLDYWRATQRTRQAGKCNAKV
jgi:hypothetical protein